MTHVSNTISSSFSDQVTWAATDESLASSKIQARKQEWNQLIDHQLVEWALHPESLGDDYYVAPSSAALRRACKLAQLLRDLHWATPQRIAANGNGGIGFEWELSRIFHVIGVNEDGVIDQTLFKDGAMVYSGTIA